MLPYAIRDGLLRVAMADPGNLIALDDVRLMSGLDVVPVVAARDQILSAIERYTGRDSDLDDLASDFGVSCAARPRLAHRGDRRQPGHPLRELGPRPSRRGRRVRRPHRAGRARRAGALPRGRRAPRGGRASEADPGCADLAAEGHGRHQHRRAPDPAGRPDHDAGRRSIRRPARGDACRRCGARRSCSGCWTRPACGSTSTRWTSGPGNATRFGAAISRPYGLVLVTGPTGSGKTTTLYGALNRISVPAINVITVEDPVEFRLPGINQIQVNSKANLTFALALRAILRADPDVVLIGEIRDRETAQIAIEAALTGHLVLSTMHTNDAPSAVTRLVEIGIEPFLVGSSVACVLAQRLARRLCEKCKEPYEPTAAEMESARFSPDLLRDGGVLYRPVGCAHCAQIGYRGRMAVHEVMTMSEQLERLTVEGVPASQIGSAARAEGMETLRDDGFVKAAAGLDVGRGNPAHRALSHPWQPVAEAAGRKIFGRLWLLCVTTHERSV